MVCINPGCLSVYLQFISDFKLLFSLTLFDLLSYKAVAIFFHIYVSHHYTEIRAICNSVPVHAFLDYIFQFISVYLIAMWLCGEFMFDLKFY